MKIFGYGALAILSITVLYTLTLIITGYPARSGEANVLSVTTPLELDKTTHDYGDINIYGGDVLAKFTLSNSNTEAITVKKIVTSCMCTTATIENKSFGMHSNPSTTITINPGESKELTVAYDPLAHGDTAAALGPVTRQVYIETNSTVTPTFELKLSGNVIKQ